MQRPLNGTNIAVQQNRQPLGRNGGRLGFQAWGYLQQLRFLVGAGLSDEPPFGRPGRSLVAGRCMGHGSRSPSGGLAVLDFVGRVVRRPTPDILWEGPVVIVRPEPG